MKPAALLVALLCLQCAPASPHSSQDARATPIHAQSAHAEHVALANDPPTAKNSPSDAAPCLPYEPLLIELTGTLERRDYAGPPNYESIADGDAKETTWLLHLDRAACTQASDDNDARLGIQELQLVFDPSEHPYEKYRPLMGQHITARGSLFTALTGHHHTDVLIMVSELAASAEPASSKAQSPR